MQSASSTVEQPEMMNSDTASSVPPMQLSGVNESPLIQTSDDCVLDNSTLAEEPGFLSSAVSSGYPVLPGDHTTDNSYIAPVETSRGPHMCATGRNDHEPHIVASTSANCVKK